MAGGGWSGSWSGSWCWEWAHAREEEESAEGGEEDKDGDEGSRAGGRVGERGGRGGGGAGGGARENGDSSMGVKGRRWERGACIHRTSWPSKRRGVYIGLSCKRCELPSSFPPDSLQLSSSFLPSCTRAVSDSRFRLALGEGRLASGRPPPPPPSPCPSAPLPPSSAPGRRPTRSSTGRWTARRRRLRRRRDAGALRPLLAFEVHSGPPRPRLYPDLLQAPSYFKNRRAPLLLPLMGRSSIYFTRLTRLPTS